MLLSINVLIPTTPVFDVGVSSIFPPKKYTTFLDYFSGAANIISGTDRRQGVPMPIISLVSCLFCPYNGQSPHVYLVDKVGTMMVEMKRFELLSALNVTTLSTCLVLCFGVVGGAHRQATRPKSLNSVARHATGRASVPYTL